MIIDSLAVKVIGVGCGGQAYARPPPPSPYSKKTAHAIGYKNLRKPEILDGIRARVRVRRYPEISEALKKSLLRDL